METVNIMIVGVGGQGSLMASKMLGHLLVNAGYDVKLDLELQFRIKPLESPAMPPK